MARAAVRPISSHERVEKDFYAESVWAAQAIFKVERFPGPVVDPALGIGTTLNAAYDSGHLDVVGADLVDRGAPRFLFDFTADFLDGEKWLDAYIANVPRYNGAVGSVVCNPPYKRVERRALSERFVFRALELARFKVAALLPLAFLEGDERSRWLETTPLARVWVSRSRVGLRPDGKELEHDGGTKAFAWFVFEHGWRGPAQLGWFDKPKAAA